MKVLITGIAGQDGTILARILHRSGYKVFGLIKDTQVAFLENKLGNQLVIPTKLYSPDSIFETLDQLDPDVIVNLAGFSSVTESWRDPLKTIDTNTQLPAALLKWLSQKKPKTRFIQASSSEIYGNTTISPQNITTPLFPVSPYGASKAFSHLLVDQYRSKYKLNASCAILYNHESVLRNAAFVTRHISIGVSRIGLGMQDKLTIGNLLSRRDWGWAPDYVEGIRRLIEFDAPKDYIFSSGVSHSVQDLVEIAFKAIGVIDFQKYLKVDPALKREVDPIDLVGDFAESEIDLGWKPTKTIEKVLTEMVDFDTLRLSGKLVDHWDYL